MEIVDTITHFFAKQPESYERKKNYEQSKVIGTGSFGQVRLAKKLDTSQDVAIKVILKKSMVGNFHLVYRELEAMRKLQHPNIVHFIDYFESKNKFYMVLELAEGGELFDRLYELGRLTEKDSISYIKQTLKAVEYLHSNNIVHRDIKPENLLFKSKDHDSPLLLADFGISKILQKEDQMLSTICGSHGYTAPEVLLGKKYGRPIDLWSIGIVTYMLLAGSNPFRMYEQTSEWIPAMSSSKINFPSKYWKLISEDAKDFVKGLLKGDPDERLTATQALNHPWIAGKDAKDHNLLEEDPPESDVRNKFRRAMNKLRVINSWVIHNDSSTESLPQLNIPDEKKGKLQTPSTEGKLNEKVESENKEETKEETKD